MNGELHDKLEEQLITAMQCNIKTVRRDPYRLQFHIMPPFGRLEAPCGFCQFQGQYHLFFCYAPLKEKEIPRLWGHCTSRDLVHWTDEGSALLPDRPFDSRGLHSGSALADKDTLRVYYTGEGADSAKDSQQKLTAILAASHNGTLFDGKQPVMIENQLFKAAHGFARDPKVWKESENYYMVMGASLGQRGGAALLFRSEDGMDWSFTNELAPEKKFGYQWEHADLFWMDHKRILSVSCRGAGLGETPWASADRSGYFTVEGDLDSEYRLSGFTDWDEGFDFYAPQTMLSMDGRRLLIARMGLDSREYKDPTAARGWEHALTVLRELRPSHGRILQQPARELDGFWNAARSIQCFKEHVIPGLVLYEMGIDSIKNVDFSLVLAGGLKISYDAATGLFAVEFTDSKLGAGRKRKQKLIGRLDSLRILADSSSVEIFINEGETVFSTRFYPADPVYEAKIRCMSCHVRIKEKR